MSRFITIRKGSTIKVECTDCGESETSRDKGYGRIKLNMFRQDHTCTEEGSEK